MNDVDDRIADGAGTEIDGGRVHPAERFGSRRLELHSGACDQGADGAGGTELRAGPLLLVEGSRGGRAYLQQALTARGFVVTGVAGLASAEAAIADADFAYAVISLQVRDGESLSFIQRLRQRDAAMRIVIVTDADSFASVISGSRGGCRRLYSATGGGERAG